jgi:hypothetical protein
MSSGDRSLLCFPARYRRPVAAAGKIGDREQQIWTPQSLVIRTQAFIHWLSSYTLEKFYGTALAIRYFAIVVLKAHRKIPRNCVLVHF